MQTLTRAVLAAGLFVCVALSAVQAKKTPPPPGPSCQTINGTCVNVSCIGECGPAFPSRCTCLGN